MSSRRIYLDQGVEVRDRGNARGADRGGVLSRRVLRLEYHHREEGRGVARFHDFAPGVTLEVLPGARAALLYRPDGEPIARDF